MQGAILENLVESRCESSRNVKQSFDDDDNPIGNRAETNLLFVLKEFGTQFSFVDSQHHEY